jgi:hypothetical protein
MQDNSLLLKIKTTISIKILNSNHNNSKTIIRMVDSKKMITINRPQKIKI